MSEITVLVVDDLEDMRSLLGMTLRRSGWQTLEAANGQQAIEVAEQNKPDVILMDYDMPICNGMVACKTIKESESTAHIPVIIYTGHGGLGIEQQAMEAGASIFLLKPIPANQLKETIRHLLNIEDS